MGAPTRACVATTVGRTTYVSAATTALVPQGTDPPVVPAAGSRPPPAAPAREPRTIDDSGRQRRTPRSPSRARAQTMRLGVLGLTMVLVGAAAMFVARRRRPERA